jgi:hypothetical protein
LASALNAAARQMKLYDTGDVILLADGQVCGVVTDRDVVVREAPNLLIRRPDSEC